LSAFVNPSPNDSNVVTLRRADVSSPSYYEVQRYTLRYQGAEDLKQAVVSLHEITRLAISDFRVSLSF
jgi:hypothetical protein